MTNHKNANTAAVWISSAKASLPPAACIGFCYTMKSQNSLFPIGQKKERVLCGPDDGGELVDHQLQRDLRGTDHVLAALPLA